MNLPGNLAAQEMREFLKIRRMKKIRTNRQADPADA